ncbi:MAG: FeoB-associated Cys-rich membrane protein [Bacilli bacterium]|jgi:regulatory protein YycI of two-component signal transduction system YycFG
MLNWYDYVLIFLVIAIVIGLVFFVNRSNKEKHTKNKKGCKSGFNCSSCSTPCDFYKQKEDIKK